MGKIARMVRNRANDAKANAGGAARDLAGIAAKWRAQGVKRHARGKSGRGDLRETTKETGIRLRKWPPSRRAADARHLARDAGPPCAAGARPGGRVADTLAEAAPDTTRTQRSAFAKLMMIRIAVAVRHAITLPPKAARRRLAMFRRTLPRAPAVLDAG